MSAVTDNSGSPSAPLRNVTLSCRECHRGISLEETVYRGTRWDLTVGDCCLEFLHRERGYRHSREHRECEWCGRSCHTAGRRGSLLSRFCSIACQTKYLRQEARQAIECAGCGMRFVPSRGNSRHCSPACKQLAYRLRKAAVPRAESPA